MCEEKPLWYDRYTTNDENGNPKPINQTSTMDMLVLMGVDSLDKGNGDSL
jgi:hypothetical protein